MIEYDKANVTSSYPSLTEYEVATLLDKAYLALIAQKLTGNNQRRVPFEGDNKAIADIEPLITHADPGLFNNNHTPAINITQFRLPTDCLYFLQAFLNYNVDAETEEELPYDTMTTRLLPMELTTHKIAEKFMCSPYNMPWVKNPVCYIEDGVVYSVYDPINKPVVEEEATAHLTYIRKPISFVDSLTEQEDNNGGDEDPNNPDPVNPDPVDPVNTGVFKLNVSQLNSTDKIQ
ncbi:MAG: hypothetical protein VZQ98_11270 [Bacteroidales bacterium]|nr:hypothetical protein [Bacteroidales bacterium]